MVLVSVPKGRETCVFTADLKAVVDSNDVVSSRGSFRRQRPDRKICVVRRISDGMKECKGNGSQRKSEAVEKECRNFRKELSVENKEDGP